jgi:serine/threonine protein kinase
MTHFDDQHPVRQELERKYGVKFLRHRGTGGFNDVWHAQVDDAEIALKISLQPLGGGNGVAERELDIVKQPEIRKRPDIVRYFGKWLVCGHLVTRWDLGDASLFDRLWACQQQGQPGISVEELLQPATDQRPSGWLIQAAATIDFINGLGTQHLDIKPQNLILFGDALKLADFGLAKFIGATTYFTSRGSGTPGYMPAEAYDGEYNPTTYLFGLAATALHLITGRPPFGDPQKVRQVFLL